VIVTHLPVTRYQVCHRTAPAGPGTLSQVLTGHYRRLTPKRPASRFEMGLPARMVVLRKLTGAMTDPSVET